MCLRRDHQNYSYVDPTELWYKFLPFQCKINILISFFRYNESILRSKFLEIDISFGAQTRTSVG